MRKIKFATLLIKLNLLYYVIYNTYFGWNFRPINHAEEICDWIYQNLVVIALCVYLLPLLDKYEQWIKRDGVI